MNRSSVKFVVIGVFVTALVLSFVYILTGIGRDDDDSAVVASTQAVMFSQLGMG